MSRGVSIRDSDDEGMEEPQAVHAASCAVWQDDNPCDCGGWRPLAACNPADPALFFPQDAIDTALALTYCARCPVREECRGLADELEPASGSSVQRFHVYGIYGGETPAERLKRRREAARA